jgi:hypothetical protein
MSKKDEVRADYQDQLPINCQNRFKKAYSGKSKANAISAKCMDCCAFQRDEVKNCTVYICPLWDYRPYK